VSHWNWNAILTVIVTIAGALIHHAVKTPKDHDRALHLAALADDFAAAVVTLNPMAPWATMVQDIVNRLKAAAGLNVSDAHALERAAQGALMRLGKSPEGATIKK
jgi:hypothetical protein